MTLLQYLDSLSSTERKAQEEVWIWATLVLDEADLGHVWKVIARECRFPESAWEDLFAALNDAKAEALEEAMTEVFRNRKLEGREIEDTPVPKGRAISRPDFAGLMERTQAFSSADAREQFFEDRRADRPPTAPYHQQLRNCPLGRYLIWSTFQQPVDDPFEGLPDAAAVREGMSLPPPQGKRDRELVLLVYRVPTDLPVRYPTIAEAYAAEGWNERFECSTPNDPWGYTQGGRPEVVHDVIDGTHLVRENDYAPQAVRIVR